MNTPLPKPKTKLDTWMDLIRQQKMPVFDATVQKIFRISRDDKAPLSDLASIILHDPAFTARVLKLANSIHYNPSSTAISTITRAVIVLGINAVCNISLTLSLVEATIEGAAKQRFARELGRAMHAAVQARGLAMARGDKSPEEVFIATLLTRIGELAFWCFGGELGEQLERLSNTPGISPEQAQERLLGFRLSQLSRQLIHEWHLTELLQDTVDHPTKRNDRVLTLALGHQIARCAEEKGWQSPDMEKLVNKSAILAALSKNDARSMLHQEARQACIMATDYGADFAAPYIPQPASSRDRSQEPTGADTSVLASQPAPPPAGGLPSDQLTQMKILRELATLLAEERCDLNVIMELVLEGIYRGIGMDRVLFALTTPDKRIVKAKYALGVDNEHLMQEFQFVRAPGQTNILFETLDRKLPRLVNARDQESGAAIPESLERLVESATFMLAPIIVSNQCIGVLYADRGPSKRPLDPTSFQDFKHFAYQANMGLTEIRSRQRG